MAHPTNSEVAHYLSNDTLEDIIAVAFCPEENVHEADDCFVCACIAEDEKRIAEFNCIDCEVNTLHIKEFYMVHEHVWTSAGLECDDGMLCLSCLESRLERQLTPDDFTEAPINQPGFAKSELFQSRVGHA